MSRMSPAGAATGTREDEFLYDIIIHLLYIAPSVSCPTVATREICAQREEQEATEWRRRVEECGRQAKEEAARREVVLEQTAKKLNDYWTLQMQTKEVGISIFIRDSPVLEPLLEVVLYCATTVSYDYRITAYLQGVFLRLLLCRGF